MPKTIRTKKENLADMLKTLEIGDQSIYDEVTCYEITKVPGGYIYKNEYVGLTFVPDADIKTVRKNIPRANIPLTK